MMFAHTKFYEKVSSVYCNVRRHRQTDRHIIFKIVVTKETKKILNVAAVVNLRNKLFSSFHTFVLMITIS